jgi:hypothetical protein
MDKRLARMMNELGGQMTLRMAVLDITREGLSEKAGNPDSVLQGLQSGDLVGITLSQTVDTSQRRLVAA